MTEGRLDDLARRAWKEHGVLPQALWDQTPHQLLALFYSVRRDGEGFGGADPVELLTRHNRDVLARAGKPPRAPVWFLPRVPARR